MATNYCPSCGTALNSSASFCGNCGRDLGAGSLPVPLVLQGSVAAVMAVPFTAMASCNRCGQPSAADRRFCQFCGQFRAILGQQVRYAGFGRRLGAFLLDFVTPYAALFFVLGVAGASGSSELMLGTTFLFAVGWVALQFSFWAKGTTVGKSMVGTWVAQTNGSRATFGTMILREFVGKFLIGSAVSFLSFGIGGLLWYMWPLWDKDSQALHDKIASTVVVFE